MPGPVHSNASLNRSNSFTILLHISALVFRLMVLWPPLSSMTNREYLMKQKRHKYLYVALGIQESDPGFAVVSPTLSALGQASKISASFWQIKSTYSAEEAFKQINTSMLDRRIDGSATLMLLDPASGQAHWHLRQPLSDLIKSYWDYQNNLFVSFAPWDGHQNGPSFFERVTRLGMWAPISKTIWYVSTSIAAKDAFHYLIDVLEHGDRLSLLDSHGDIAFWQEGIKPDNQVSRLDRDPVSNPVKANRGTLSTEKNYITTSFK